MIQGAQGCAGIYGAGGKQTPTSFFMGKGNMKIAIEIKNNNQLATLMHCLKYGRHAVSQNEVKSGEAAKRDRAIEQFTEQIYDQLTEKQFEKYAL